MPSNVLRWFVLAASLSVPSASFVGCASDPTPPSDGGAPDAGHADARVGRCTPDPAELAIERECLSDDTCPCAAHCELGVCVSDCMSAGDCGAGERCDDFGRCRAAAETALVPLAESSLRRGTVRARGPVVVPAAGEATFTVDVVDFPARVRVAARRGAEVACTAGASFTHTCELAELAANTRARVRVRLTADATAKSAPIVRVYGETNHVTLSVIRPDQLLGSKLPAPGDVRVPVALAGTYEGSLTMVTADADALPGEPLLGEASFPVRAELWSPGGGIFTLSLEDSMHALSSDGALTGQGTSSGTTELLGQVTMADQPFLDVALGPSERTVVLTRFARFTVRFDPDTGELIALIRTIYVGAHDEVRPNIEWALRLSRSGDPSGRATPTPDTAATLPYDEATRTSDGLAWAEAIAAIDDANARRGPTASQTVEGLAARWGSLVGEPTTLECTDPAFALEAAHVVWGLLHRDAGSLMPGDPFRDGFAWQILAGLGTDWDGTYVPTAVEYVGSDAFLLASAGEWRTNEIPCAGQFAVSVYDGAGAGTTRMASRRQYIEQCEELSRRIGCDIEVRNRPVVLFGQPLYVTGSGDIEATTYTAGVPVLARAEVRSEWAEYHVCVVPTDRGASECGILGAAGATDADCRRVAPRCSELATCAVPDKGASPLALRGAPVGGARRDTGDVECADTPVLSGTGRGATIELDLQGSVSTIDAVEGCIADLERLRDAPAISGTGPGPRLASALTDSSCIDAVRTAWAMAIGLADQDVRQTGAPDPFLSPAAAAVEGRRHALRLVRRWLDLHAFMATEARERGLVAAWLREEMAPMGQATSDEVLDASLGGWDLILQPAILGGLMGASDADLASPDYTAPLLGAGDPNTEVTSSLPASIQRLAAAQLNLATAMTEDRWRHASASPDASIVRVVPYVIFARALGGGLAARARRDAAWADRAFEMGNADRALGAATGEAGRVSRSIARGDNPLGIAATDIPLYYVADGSTGPGGRFAAISDFIAGTGPSSSGWAPMLVAAAADAEAAARSSYLMQRDRELWRSVADRSYLLRVEDEAYGYDVDIREHCGPLLNPVADDTFNAANCFIADRPECRPTIPEIGEMYDEFESDDLLGRLCVGAYQTCGDELALRPCTPDMSADECSAFRANAQDFCDAFRRAFPSPDPFPTVICPLEVVTNTCHPIALGTEGALAFARDCYRADGSTAVSVRACADSQCLHCDSNPTVAELPLGLSTLEFISATPSVLTEAVEVCRERHPGFRPEITLPISLDERGPSLDPSCLTGSLGDDYLAIQTASRDLEIARAEASEALDRYDIAVQSCLILARSSERIAAANAAFEDQMDDLLTSREAAEGVAAIADATRQCLSTVSGVDATAVWSIGTAIGSCVAGGVVASAEVSIAVTQANIERAEIAHDSNVDLLERTADVEICFNDARQELVGLRAATLRIQQSYSDFNAAVARWQTNVVETARLQADGISYVAAITARKLPPAYGEVWSEEAQVDWANRFRIARRATYLAVRAVEYEFQQSLMVQGDVIAADRTSELTDALEEIWATAATRGINGNRPSDLEVVLSLRDDVLRLSDESSLPGAGHGLTPSERLRLVLSSPAYATYDASGRYLGQQIPFEIAPLGAFGVPAGGVPIYATTDCAERLWSVNASILGAEVFVGSDTTFTRIDLLKENTFYSQWCSPPNATDPPFQLASVRPAVNLFREPGSGSGVDDSVFGGADPTRLLSRARIQAYFNVSRAELEDPMYENGSTGELGGRGLYGRYALFVPAELISREDGARRTDGLALDRVDDILLRFDYVSVAR